MDAREPLATGTLLTLDGRAADTRRLADPDALDALLADLAGRLEADADADPVRIADCDGTSHARVLDEAWLILHAFPERGRFALAVFSRHAVGERELHDAALDALGGHGAEATVRRRAAGVPEGRDALVRRLRGERAWARARHAPLPRLDAD